MATHPKQAQHGIVAEARLVAAMTREHFAAFAAADAQRKVKFLPESRLGAFEGAVAELEKAIGGRMVAFTSQMGATWAEGELRTRLYAVLRDVREEVKLGYLGDAAIGYAFGVGVRMSGNSTPRVLSVARRVLASWERPEYREAAMNVGIAHARMEEVRGLTEALGTAQAAQDVMCGAARGQTLVKDEQLAKVRRETVYLRRVARFVFRKQPEVLAAFASTVPRRVARRRVSQVLEGQGVDPQGQGAALRRQRASSPRQGASSSRQEAAFPRQDASSLGQDGSFPRQEGAFVQAGASLPGEGVSSSCKEAVCPNVDVASRCVGRDSRRVMPAVS
jgi:hypothetical protein